MATPSAQLICPAPPCDSNCEVVHIIDDDRAYAAALAAQLHAPGFVPSVYLSAEQFLSTYQPGEIECGIVDLRMPGISGLELQDILLQQYQQLQLIIISGYGRTPDVVRAVRNGAVDFLEKPVAEDVLAAAIRAALAKDRQRKGRRLQRDRALWHLSDREREVLNLFVAAKSTLEIARRLGISPKTVEKHRVHIFEKTNVDSVPALIRLVLDSE